jgi:hypothetical protein
MEQKGQPTNGGPPAWGLDEGLKKSSLYKAGFLRNVIQDLGKVCIRKILFKYITI